ncbi:transcription factor mef2A-like [Chelonus insularis]|uniref:transcription factor mef2A-like n=1 Tax=Chelonus insularis TaxID=460826 RepID=UPI00158EFB3D|nr:transcription factor mef2A-like [Chelonus insularis]
MLRAIRNNALNIILLLLYWPCVRSAETNHDIDQVAVASYALSSVSKITNHDIDRTLLSPSSKFNHSTIHYENSNGFVPILSDTNHNPVIVGPPRNERSFSTENYEKHFSNDFKLVLNNSNPDANRRLDSQDDQKEFEILKVNEKIPAVANYHDFYENLQKPQNIYQYGAADYDAYAKNNWNTQAVDAQQNQHQKPVVVQPSDYKVNVNYNPQPTFKVTTLSPPSYKSAHKYERNLSEDRYDRSEDYSDENTDYYEITERSRKLHKSRRKPYSDSSRKLPKEHRVPDDLVRTKSHRNRGKPSYWNEEDHSSQEENSGEATKETQYRDKGNGKKENQKEKSNSWSQIGPNVEFSPSNAYELSQIDKPDVLVPVNFKLVPVTNFDHNTAIGNSQGFDVSNTGASNFVPSGSIVSTASPLVSSGPPIMMQTTPATPIKNGYVYSTVSDIVVGQNSFQTPIQTLLLPQSNSKYNSNVKTYIQSTATPIYVNPTMQSLTTMQSTGTSKPHVVAPQVTGPQLFYPSSTVQPIYHTPASPTNYNIMINPHSMHGQNIPTQSPTNNHGNVPSYSGENQKKNTFSGSHGHLIASASYSVGHGDQSQNSNANNNNNHNSNNRYYVPVNNLNTNVPAAPQANAQVLRPQMQTNVYPVYKNENIGSRIKTYLPHIVPGFIQATPVPAVSMINYGQPQGQQYTNVGNNILENTWKQLQQLQANEQQKYQNLHTYPGRDHTGSPSSNHEHAINVIQANDKGQLPVVGMQNIEIMNPNLTPVAAQVIPQFPTAVVTTPIPIISTPGGFIATGPVVTPTPVEPNTVQNYVDSLTHIGTKATGQHSGADSFVYNPMNFVPNMELIKSQTILNGKIQEPLPPSLNLVPIVPGGKFYKHDHAAQSDLITKPKLSSDLEKYAEEMFKESIRTIYNTHKWNTDRKVKNLTFADGVDYGKLKKDLEKLRAAMANTKYGKEVLEAHHSETQFRTADPLRSKRPGLSVAALEHLFKNDFKPSSDSHLLQRPSEIKINDFLTPPEVNSFVAGNSFIDKSKKKKKRTKARPHSRPSSHNSRPNNLETSASHVTFHRRPHHTRNVNGDYRGKENKFDNYPTFTTSSPDFTVFQLPKNHHTSKSDYIDFNLPRTHNFLGWLMKAKQLPPGAAESIANNYNENDYPYYFDENRRIYQRQPPPMPPVPVSYFQYYR